MTLNCHPVSLYAHPFYFRCWWLTHRAAVNIHYPSFVEHDLCFHWVHNKEGKSWVLEPFTLCSVLGWHSLRHPLLLLLPVAETLAGHQQTHLWSFLNSNIPNEQQELCSFPISYACPLWNGTLGERVSTLVGHWLKVVSYVLEISIKCFTCNLYQIIHKIGKPRNAGDISVNQRMSIGGGIHFGVPFLLHPLGMLGLVCCFSVFLFNHATGVSFHWHLPSCLSWAETLCFVHSWSSPFSSSPGRQCPVHKGVLHLSTQLRML